MFGFQQLNDTRQHPQETHIVFYLHFYVFATINKRAIVF